MILSAAASHVIAPHPLFAQYEEFKGEHESQQEALVQLREEVNRLQDVGMCSRFVDERERAGLTAVCLCNHLFRAGAAPR